MKIYIKQKKRKELYRLDQKWKQKASIQCAKSIAFHEKITKYFISHEKSPNTFNTKTNLCLYLYICLALYLAVIRQSEKEFYGWFFILILMADNNDLCCMRKINFLWQDAFEIDNKR